MVHPVSSSAKLNELLLHASSKYILIVSGRFCELASFLGRRKLRTIFIYLYFFFITRAYTIFSRSGKLYSNVRSPHGKSVIKTNRLNLL